MTAHAGALSQHPHTAEAVGEIVGHVLEVTDESPDLAILLSSPHHRAALGDAAAAVRELLRPGLLLGATAGAVLAGAAGTDGGPGLALFTARLPAPPRPVRLTARRTPGGLAVQGLTADLAGAHGTLLLCADGSLPVEGILEGLAATGTDLTVVGGLASAGADPGDNVLLLDDELVTDGGVGALLPPGALAATVVVPGCRPIGDPMIVTAAEGSTLVRLAGRPALDRVDELVAATPPDERPQLARGLHIGIALDEHRATFGPGDFLVRDLVGADPGRRALVVGEAVPVGTTVQFQLRDPASADEQLRAALAGIEGAGALVFTGADRDRPAGGLPGHDARTVSEALGTRAVAGMFSAGEIGPVGRRSHLHASTASVAVFRDPGDSR